MKKSRTKSGSFGVAFILGLLFAFIVFNVAAAFGGDLRRGVVNSGGGLISNNELRLRVAIGEPVVGTVSGEFTLCSGYHCGPVVPVSGDGRNTIYLPVVLK
jgi:hypothetical protein